VRFAARESEGREAKRGYPVKKQVFDGLNPRLIGGDSSKPFED
jgi:hypothetical protein